MFIESNLDLETPIVKLGEFNNNSLYIKREDMIPYSFGGNKARKGFYYFNVIDARKYDCVVTYGSSHSNHCRIIANMAVIRNMPCYIVEPNEASNITYNSKLVELFNAEKIKTPLNKVHDAIQDKLYELKNMGRTPYFIQGGGHGVIGTQAYVDCYREIKNYENTNKIFFDYIFLASGTGTTHAGLVCGQIMNGDERQIIGISVARKNPYGKDVVIDSVREYLQGSYKGEIQEKVWFIDAYIAQGYGGKNREIEEVIKQVMVQYGIPLDGTYTGKAFWGMQKYIETEKIKNKKILFIHTGGTPLFFDDLRTL